MTVGHLPRRIGLALALVVLAAPALAAPGPAAAEPRAVIAFAPEATLDDLEALPGAAVSMFGATQGRYRQVQALLDISQGARTSLAAYQPPTPPALGVLPDGRVAGWPDAVRRAEAAPAPIVPGLLASAVPGGAGYVGEATASRDPAIVAADEHGRVAALALPADRGKVLPAVRDLLGDHRLVVVRLPDVAALRALVAQRDPETLVLAMAEPPFASATRLLPIGVVGLGGGRTLTSSTTRTDGLVTGIDVAPTVLRWLSLPVPSEMSGQEIRLDGALDVAELRDLHARLRVVTSRRHATLGALAASWAVLALAALGLGGRRGGRWAVRTGALGVLWILPVLLPFAALSPARWVEVVGVGWAALALGALCDRLLRWPVAAAVPALTGVVAYVVDLAFGSPLIVTSLLGPNPLFGSRFYGIGNELESTLPVLLLTGVAAAMCWLRRGDRSTSLALAFAGGGLVLGAALGSGRLGADVGGVITMGGGAATAVLLALPGRITRARIAVAVLVPVAALAALAALDLATGGDGHFTRTVLRADDGEALAEVVQRRYQLAWNNLRSGLMPLLTALSLVAIAWGVVRRDRLLAGVPYPDAWRAGLAGSAAAGVVGALSNDSGPMLLVFATFVASWVAAYLRARPDRPIP